MPRTKLSLRRVHGSDETRQRKAFNILLDSSSGFPHIFNSEPSSLNFLRDVEQLAAQIEVENYLTWEKVRHYFPLSELERVLELSRMVL